MPFTSTVARFFLACGLLIAAATGWAADDKLTVYKTPGCGCCNRWIEHLRAAGFEVEAHNAGNLDALRREWGVPRRLAGCHTARIGDYVIEGHVPAAQIQRLLREKPAVVGISVPGMPIGSPGMEGPGGGPYDVLTWDKAGRTTVFSTEQPAR